MMSTPAGFDQVVTTQTPDAQAAMMLLVTNLLSRADEVARRLETIERLLQTPATVASLQLPLPPVVLNQMINAVGIPGLATMGVNKFSMVVPAGFTVTATVPARDGKATLSTAAMRVTATYYNVLITARVWIDGQELTSPDYPYSLTGEDAVDFGQYYYSLKNLTATVANPTATPTIITFKSEGIAVDKNFFQGFYLPLIGLSYSKMRDLAVSVNGGKPLP